MSSHKGIASCWTVICGVSVLIVGGGSLLWYFRDSIPFSRLKPRSASVDTPPASTDTPMTQAIESQPAVPAQMFVSLSKEDDAATWTPPKYSGPKINERRGVHDRIGRVFQEDDGASLEKLKKEIDWQLRDIFFYLADKWWKIDRKYDVPCHPKLDGMLTASTTKEELQKNANALVDVYFL